MGGLSRAAIAHRKLAAHIRAIIDAINDSRNLMVLCKKDSMRCATRYERFGVKNRRAQAYNKESIYAAHCWPFVYLCIGGGGGGGGGGWGGGVV